MFGLRPGSAGRPLLVWAALLAIGAPACASGAAALCVDAAQRAAAEHDVPVAVMLAITLTETGRRVDGQVQPWPWAVNAGGESHWFETRAEAAVFAQSHLDGGATSFDLGCFQLNWRWHHAAFGTIEAMFDPLANARYAAAFLSRLHAETGDWSRAAGAYHSRTEVYAARYRARFADNLAIAGPMSGAAAPVALAAAAPLVRRNAFPLLRAGAGGGALGSLVPLSGLE